MTRSPTVTTTGRAAAAAVPVARHRQRPPQCRRPATDRRPPGGARPGAGELSSRVSCAAPRPAATASFPDIAAAATARRTAVDDAIHALFARPASRPAHCAAATHANPNPAAADADAADAAADAAAASWGLAMADPFHADWPHW